MFETSVSVKRTVSNHLLNTYERDVALFLVIRFTCKYYLFDELTYPAIKRMYILLSAIRVALEHAPHALSHGEDGKYPSLSILPRVPIGRYKLHVAGRRGSHANAAAAVRRRVAPHRRYLRLGPSDIPLLRHFRSLATEQNGRLCVYFLRTINTVYGATQRLRRGDARAAPRETRVRAVSCSRVVTRGPPWPTWKRVQPSRPNRGGPRMTSVDRASPGRRCYSR